MTAADFADHLLKADDLPELSVVKSLRKTLRNAEDEWITDFREKNGMVGIYKVIGFDVFPALDWWSVVSGPPIRMGPFHCRVLHAKFRLLLSLVPVGVLAHWRATCEM